MGSGCHSAKPIVAVATLLNVVFDNRGRSVSSDGDIATDLSNDRKGRNCGEGGWKNDFYLEGGAAA